MGAPLQPPFLVCSQCLVALAELGAVACTERREISAGHACELHPTNLNVQSQHAVLVSRKVLRTWRHMARRSAVPVDPALLSEAAALEVARIAAGLLHGATVGDLWVSDALIENAVGTARRILLAAKGG
ncbi:MAG: hypothetical protein JWL95_3229 [Gemmatimonadetes bacterium]|nr:hypothetical protein [Gemmatimonadota bacterium]